MALNPIGFVRGKTMADAIASGVNLNDVFLTSQSVAVSGTSLQINRTYLGKELVAVGHRMTSELEGLGKLYTDTLQSVAPTDVFKAANRTYGLQIDTNGKLVVNVPWEDSYDYAGTDVAGTFLLTTDIAQSSPHYYMGLDSRTFTDVSAANLPDSPADGVFYKISADGLIDKTRLTKIVGEWTTRQFPYVAAAAGEILLKAGDVLYKQPGGTGYELVPVNRNTLIPIIPTQLAVDKAIDDIQARVGSSMVFIGVIAYDALPLHRTYTATTSSGTASKVVRSGDTWKISNNGTIANDRLMNPVPSASEATIVRNGDILVATQVPTNETDNVKYTLIPAGDAIPDTWREWTINFTNADGSKGTQTYGTGISTSTLNFSGALGLTASISSVGTGSDTRKEIVFNHAYQFGHTSDSYVESNRLTTGGLINWESSAHYYPAGTPTLAIGKIQGAYDNEDHVADSNYIIVDQFGHIKVCGTKLRDIVIPVASYATTPSHRGEALLGLVKLGYVENQDTNPKAYRVQINNGDLYANVPWTDTHYTSKKVVNSTATAQTNGTATTYADGGLHTGKVYLNHVDNGIVTSSEQLLTDGSFQISTAALTDADTQGAITFGMYWKE